MNRGTFNYIGAPDSLINTLASGNNAAFYNKFRADNPNDIASLRINIGEKATRSEEEKKIMRANALRQRNAKYSPSMGVTLGMNSSNIADASAKMDQYLSQLQIDGGVHTVNGMIAWRDFDDTYKTNWSKKRAEYKGTALYYDPAWNVIAGYNKLTSALYAERKGITNEQRLYRAARSSIKTALRTAYEHTIDKDKFKNSKIKRLEAFNKRMDKREGDIMRLANAYASSVGAMQGGGGSGSGSGSRSGGGMNVEQIIDNASRAE